MSHRHLFSMLRVATLLTLGALAACEGSSTDPVTPDPALSIDPSSVTLIAGETATFTAEVLNSTEATVEWSVSGGTFTAEGLTLTWTAPMEPGTFVIEAVLANGIAEASAEVDVVDAEGTVREDFNAYLGSLETLPAGFFVTGEDGDGTEVGDGFDPFTGVSATTDEAAAFEGFGAFSNGTDGNSFGIRERGTTDLRDSRLFLLYTNVSDRPIVGFRVEYDVEVWWWGQRANRLRLKYGLATSGFSDLPDLASTDNPRGAAEEDDRGRVLDGRLAENRERVIVTLDLLAAGSVPNAEGEPMGPLEPGEVAFFRWQYSNASGDGGALRSGLGLNNLLIVPIYAED